MLICDPLFYARIIFYSFNFRHSKGSLQQFMGTTREKILVKFLPFVKGDSRIAHRRGSETGILLTLPTSGQ
ncbi:unnamed protein product [Larinioides sclopetarius]|uniref:Uncharacterized protein n=1 Tax=Larinioides sclopetarius TaxID=280406 RepID=A0AAV2C1J4_9ARAC